MSRGYAFGLACLVVLGTATNAGAQSAQVKSFGYARLGYSGVLAEGVAGAPAIGFGLRGEQGALALDVSFLNFALALNARGGDEHVLTGSKVKLSALKLLNPNADGSAYLGGGLSWGFASVGRTGTRGATSWHGSGLQGELSAGYEVGRKGDLRMFVQADASLPFYGAVSETFVSLGPGSPGSPTPPGGTVRSDRRYIPSIVASVGIGWNRRGRP